MAIRVTTVGAQFDMSGKHHGIGPWLGVIHEVNRMVPRTFDAASFVNDERGHVEVYGDADVIFVGKSAQDQIVTIVSKTHNGARLIKAAAETLGLKWEEN